MIEMYLVGRNTETGKFHIIRAELQSRFHNTASFTPTEREFNNYPDAHYEASRMTRGDA